MYTSFGPLCLLILWTQFLRTLVVVYISPETAHNLELRQCLSYFFPVYCYSSTGNQRRMQQVSSA